MIPIRDTIPSKNNPIVNQALIGVNVLVFLVQLSQGADLDGFIYLYGLVPARYSISHVSAYFSSGQQLFSFFSFMFLHGGVWHILGNMWSLYIFGDNVEDRLGPLRYLVFYLLCGLASGLFHLFFNLNSNVPTIGASGAVAGVMGAYFLLYPSAKILTLIPIIIIPWLVEVPAFLFLGVWFVMQILNAAGSQAGGIAWWAHIGGFLFGIFLLKLLLTHPSIGATERIQRATVKKKSDRLQVIQPQSKSGDNPHLYGEVVITYYESLTGTRKLVNIPWGFHNRIFNISIPSGTREGNVLRLRGLGKALSDGGRGDLYLRVTIQPQPV